MKQPRETHRVSVPIDVNGWPFELAMTVEKESTTCETTGIRDLATPCRCSIEPPHAPNAHGQAAYADHLAKMRQACTCESGGDGLWHRAGCGVFSRHGAHEEQR